MAKFKVFILVVTIHDEKINSNVDELNKLISDDWTIDNITPMGGAGSGTGINLPPRNRFASTIILRKIDK